MSNSMLYRILFRQLRDGLQRSPNNEFKTKLLKEGFEMTLEDLVKCDRNVFHHHFMYLESLAFLAAEKKRESSIPYISNLLEYHKTLVSRIPNYTEGFNTSCVDICNYSF